MSAGPMNPSRDGTLAAGQVEVLRAIDTCTLANAIEMTGVRLRNEGYTDATVRCMFPEMPPIAGYAITLRVHTAKPPMRGLHHIDNVDWARSIPALPYPRVMVIQDLDGGADTGSFMGEVHASIFRALGCVAAVTNGAVRDLPALRAFGFQTFAAHVSVSHAYAHIVSVGEDVTIGGLTVRTGDLLHGDGHGVITIPDGVAATLPRIVAQQKSDERRVIDYCRSPQFSIDGLEQLLLQIRNEHPLPE